MQIDDIIIKYINGGHVTEQEAAYLQQWRVSSEAHERLFQELNNEDLLKKELQILMQFDSNKAWNELREKRITPVARLRTNIIKWMAAASLLLLAAVGGYVLFSNRNAVTPKTITHSEIKAGTEGAILTLADGSKISLDTIKSGVIALQGGVTAKLVNGALVYEGATDQVVYNTITTPKGRQMKVRLPDGSMVWLNAASSIHFPTAFPSSARKVAMTGEAYFEVAKEQNAPFIVSVNDMTEVEVLGTYFNVNAYPDEQYTKTTLLEGSVKVGWQGGRFLKIRPGQQAQMNHDNIARAQNNIEIRSLDQEEIENVVAWKNGYFDFDNSSFVEIMRQLERWYDIQVIYENGIPKVELTGNMTRDVTLNDLMEGLEKLGVHSRLEGRRLIISKQP
ncbi:FecR family protein [Chitinophaga ginsengisegetis]|uniref:FecR family protein n=1 Tax=Chitinophaga ginsengisegetis TaxID=393003 RepID=UPI00341BD912